MSTPEYTNLQLVGRHVPEDPDPSRPSPFDNVNPVTGVYQIGVLIDGAFVELFEETAGRFFHLLDTAKQNAPQQTDTPPADQAGQVQ